MKLLILAFAAVTAWCGQPGVAEIMARVAENQSHALEQRKEWVFHQKQLLRMHRGNGKMAREERREYDVMPDEKGLKKELTRLDGKYERNGKYIAYDQPGHSYKELDIDGDLINDMSNDMIGDNSRDGIGNDLFPLTPEEQEEYNFRLVGSENYRGRQVYRVAFEPKPQPKGQVHIENGNSLWKGEALIDAEEFQPVTISTSFAAKIPVAVKILLGTNLKASASRSPFRNSPTVSGSR